MVMLMLMVLSYIRSNFIDGLNIMVQDYKLLNDIYFVATYICKELVQDLLFQKLSLI